MTWNFKRFHVYSEISEGGIFSVPPFFCAESSTFFAFATKLRQFIINFACELNMMQYGIFVRFYRFA